MTEGDGRSAGSDKPKRISFFGIPRVKKAVSREEQLAKRRLDLNSKYQSKIGIIYVAVFISLAFIVLLMVLFWLFVKEPTETIYEFSQVKLLRYFFAGLLTIPIFLALKIPALKRKLAKLDITREGDDA